MKCHCFLRANRRCWNSLPDQVIIILPKLPFRRRWAVTASTGKHFDLTFVLKLSHKSLSALCMDTSTAREPDISDFTDGAEREQGKDHFANTAPRAKTEKQHWLYLVGELEMSEAFFLTPVKTKHCQSEAVLWCVTWENKSSTYLTKSHVVGACAIYGLK